MAYQHTSKVEPGRRMQVMNVLDQVRKGLDNASDSQARLATARQQLLIKRGRVRTASRKVQLKRVDAGDAEATFMSRLREYVNHHRAELPSTLLDAYDNVERTRDALGEIEENYLQAERDLTGAEWTFVDQENAFYQFDLHEILPKEESTAFVPLPDQSPAVFSQTPPPPPLPIYLPTHEKASTTPNIQTASPPSPPPPPRPSSDRSLGFPHTQQILDQDYTTVLTRVDELRKDFDHLREKKALYIDWEDSSDIVSPDVVDTPDVDLTASTMEYFDILQKISYGEAKAQQLKFEEMSQRLPASTLVRRSSDPTHVFRHPVSSTPMRRAHTESAVSSLFDDPTTKERIREWSLTYLKESTVQKRLYLNTLEHHGVLDSVGCDWKFRAEQFWNQDSCSESKGSSEYYAASTTGTSHDAGSYAEACATQRPTPSSSLRDLLRLEHHEPDQNGARSATPTFESLYATEYADIPLPSSPSLLSETTGVSNTIIPDFLVTSHSNDQLKQKAVQEESVSHQQSVAQNGVCGLTQCSDSSLRKDSCHSMDDHGDTKPSAKDRISDENTPETPGRGEKMVVPIVNTGGYENQQSSMKSMSVDDDPVKQNDELHREHVTDNVLPRLCIPHGQPSSVSPRPPVFGVRMQSHDVLADDTPSLRPTSESSGTPRSFSRRMRDFLVRTGHRRSKSTSFIVDCSSVDGVLVSRSLEKRQIVST